MGNAEAPSTSPTLLAALADWRNAEAWEAFVRGYAPFIEACARSAGMQPADVDEVCGRVLASLVASLRSFVYDPAKRFRGFIRVSVRNAVADYFRERVRRPGSIGTGGDGPRPEAAALAPALEELADGLDRRTRDDLDLLGRIFETVRGRVAATTWRAFEMTRLQQIEPHAAAAALDIPVATLYVYRGRVLAMLRTVAREFGLCEE